MKSSVLNLHSKIENLLRTEDIEGLIEIHGAAENDSEAEELAEALSDIPMTEENIISVTVALWTKMFDLDEDDIQKRMPAFISFAHKLLSPVSEE